MLSRDPEEIGAVVNMFQSQFVNSRKKVVAVKESLIESGIINAPDKADLLVAFDKLTEKLDEMGKMAWGASPEGTNLKLGEPSVSKKLFWEIEVFLTKYAELSDLYNEIIEKEANVISSSKALEREMSLKKEKEYTRIWYWEFCALA